jgi:hypothetical protein
VNVFERANITHLSPSSLNTFANEPALWVIQYLLKRKFSAGCAAHRGTASEAGVQAGLIDPAKPVEECVDLALATYDRLTAFSGDTRRVKEREAIPGIVECAVNELRLYGPLTGYQGKIVHRFDDVPVDIVGYYDFEFGAANIIVDLKTSLKLASQISTPHGRQVSHYIAGRDLEGRLCYATPAKLAVYRLENAAEHQAALNNIARRLQRFLSISADPMELASFVTPRVDEFWWSDPLARAAAMEVYGL